MKHYPRLAYDDRLFFIKKIVKESHNPIVESWKEATNADIVLKRDGNYYFCEEIQTVEYEMIDEQQELIEQIK